MIKGTLGSVAAVVTSSVCVSSSDAATVKPRSAEFYQADGAFNPEAAKKAYYAMMKNLGYPIQDILTTEAFWVCDFLQQDFSKLGMGGVFWKNASGTYGNNGAQAYSGDYKNQQFGYLGNEIFLLPGQMLPEHRHIGGPEGYGPKMEAWHVRYGSVEFFGEYRGEGTETPISDMPKSELPWGYGKPWFHSKVVAKRTAKSGEVYTLEDPESWHFQRAGAQGAIVTEYATYHNHVMFSKPGMEFASSPAT
jgi:D-lyxose ketol-isomerase